jgi:hypothetical protein
MSFPSISPFQEVDVRILDGYIGIAADGYSVASHDIKGANVTAPAFVSTGVYTITLDKSYPKFLSCHVVKDLATPISLDCNVHPDNNSPVSKLTLTFVNSSSAATALGSAGAVHVLIVLRKSSVGT